MKLNDLVKNYSNKIQYHLFGTLIRGHNNSISIKSKRDRFKLVINGNNNIVKISANCLLRNTEIYIDGDYNCLIVDEKARFIGPCKINMSNGAKLHIGENTGIRGVNFILEEASISVGKLCMFSYNIIVRNTDSHKVIDFASGCVVNHCKDVKLGNHVWVGQNVTILKGVSIGDNSIVALGAVVTKSCPPNSIVAGNPAKIVKTGITWDY